MDFILNKINQKIDILNATGVCSSILVHYQSRIEYLLTLMLGYLWNKNFENLDVQDKEIVFSEITQPTIGTVVKVCRTLDLEKEFFGRTQINKCISNYPSVRNSVLGHGYTFEDQELTEENPFEKIYSDLVSVTDSIFGKNIDFVEVIKKDGNNYKGIKYSSEQNTILSWTYNCNISEMKVGGLYIVEDDDSYHLVSPFICINNMGDNIYIYNKISNKLLGTIHYNQLINTGTLDSLWAPFAELSLSNDGFKERTSNGTIRNLYENNYTTFIDVDYESQLKSFLEKNKASVCATLWGHGGVGKTATIQHVCDYFSNKQYRTFDYIVFVSAKNRKYNYYKGVIEQLQDGISTFDDIIKIINKMILDQEVESIEGIINFGGKMLLVIDDFESFTKEEALKISDFLEKLDINHHKVIVTTRAANVSIGYEIKTNELNIEQSYRFLINVLSNECISLSSQDKQALQAEEIKKKVYNITSGRPLFLFQLAYIIGKNGLTKALLANIKGVDSAIQFLYGRLYEYLSPKAKDLFVAIGLLVNKDDLVNVIDKARYIINMENDEDSFNAALDELKKLKIVKVTDQENMYFEVYSKEILEIMNKQYEQRDPSFTSICTKRRNQINKDKSADIEHSLLNSANANRLAKSEIEVVDSYKQILNRPTSPISVKLAAVNNLTSYLLLEKGKRLDALEYFEKYSHIFTCLTKEDEYRKYYADYAKRWAIMNWGNGTDSQKQKAISVLSDYFKGGINYSNNADLEIVANLLMYRSLMIIANWRELKDKKQFNEITTSDYNQIRSTQMIECKNIHDNIGHILYSNVSNIKLTDKPSGVRQNIVTAFYNYIDVLVRLKKINDAIEICDYVINCAPHNFKEQFDAKKTWLKSIKKH